MQTKWVTVFKVKVRAYIIKKLLFRIYLWN